MVGRRKKPSQQLYEAIARQDVDRVKRLLDARASPNAYKHPHNGNTALIIAVSVPTNEGLVRLLLDAQADVNAISNNGSTPYTVAAAKGGPAMQQLLAQHTQGSASTRTTIQPNAPPTQSLLAEQLYSAVAAFEVERVKELIEARAGLEHRHPQNGNTPLIVACAGSGKENIVQLLLDAKANLSVANHVGDTPFHVAATHHQYASLRVLEERADDVSADVDASAQSELAKPLYDAVVTGEVGRVQHLIASGAPLEWTNWNGNRALLVACHQDTNPAIIRLLLDAQADVNHTNKNGDTAFTLATKSGLAAKNGGEIARMLEEHALGHRGELAVARVPVPDSGSPSSPRKAALWVAVD